MSIVDSATTLKDVAIWTDGMLREQFLNSIITEAQKLEYDKEIYQDYGNTLENGLQEICKAMGVDSERFDTDQADTECYMDCFKEAAKLIKLADFTWDDEEGEWVSGCFKAN